MTMNSTKLTLANTMMIGVIMTVCSNNWMSMWMGLEISMLSFIPFIQTSKSLSSESMVKYFIIQSAASTMFMFSVICMLIGVNMMNEMSMTVTMLIKLGSAPFHNWVLMIIENMNYMTMFNLLTMIKIPPLSILYMINSNMLIIPILMSMLVSSIMCMNQSSVRKTLGFSSIYNLSLMMSLMDKANLIVTYMTIYMFMMISVTKLIKVMKINLINQMVFNEFSMWNKMNLWINMLSLGGFPITIGFLMKIMVLQNLIENNQMLISFVLMITSLLMMMFYMRLAFTSMISMTSFKKWTLNKSKPMSFLMSLNISITHLILTLKSIL